MLFESQLRRLCPPQSCQNCLLSDIIFWPHLSIYQLKHYLGSMLRYRQMKMDVINQTPLLIQ